MAFFLVSLSENALKLAQSLVRNRLNASFLPLPNPMWCSQSGEAQVSCIFAPQIGSRKQQHGYLRWIASKERCNTPPFPTWTSPCTVTAVLPTKRWGLFPSPWAWAGLALTNGLWRNGTLGLLSPSLGAKKFHYIFLAFLEPWAYHVKKPGSTAGGQMTT